jgi:hypothetical protein
MWNVDFAGNAVDASQAVRAAVAASVDADLQRQARVFGKYLAQTIAAFETNNESVVHVVSSGTLTAAGATGVTLDVTVT